MRFRQRTTTKHYDRTDKSDNPKCAQCRKSGTKDQFKTVEIIHRGGPREIAHTKHTVCKDGPCGAHLQMAHEG